MEKEYSVTLTESEIRVLIDCVYPHIRWAKNAKESYDKLIHSLGYTNHHFETEESEKKRIENEKIIERLLK